MSNNSLMYIKVLTQDYWKLTHCIFTQYYTIVITSKFKMRTEATY